VSEVMGIVHVCYIYVVVHAGCRFPANFTVGVIILICTRLLPFRYCCLKARRNSCISTPSNDNCVSWFVTAADSFQVRF
jgi:hypothetical protein